MTWFVNYTLNSSISVTDRGLTYGDGVFETILASSYSFCRLDDHMARLYKGLEKLGMPFSREQKQTLFSFLHTDVLPLINSELVVKVIVSRGEGGRGYAPPENCTHTVIIGILSAPNYQVQQKEGVRLSVSPVPVSENRFLAGIKHLNRLENVIAKRFLMADDFEAVMLNVNDDVIECIQSNIFWFKDSVLYTPSLVLCGVEGTYRQHIIKSQDKYHVQVNKLSLPHLMAADEVFITNSLMRIVPVIQISEKSFPIGLNTRELQILMQAKDMHAVH